jgi:hypothetical protein
MDPGFIEVFLLALVAGTGWRIGNWYGRPLFLISVAAIIGGIKAIQWLITTCLNVLSRAVRKVLGRKSHTETNTTPVEVMKNTNSTETESTDQN